MVIDINQPGCVQLRREYCVRGLARCEILQGAIVVEGATFQPGASFPIYAPISHHAIELKPVQPDTIVKFSKLEIPNILNGRELFQVGDGEKIISGLYLTRERGVETPTKFSSLLNKINGRSRVCIIGGKSSGKSTANRILINSLLQKHNHIYFVEMDPGQPEFNVSGWLSLVKITKPRIGPNFCHLESDSFTLIHQRFLGNFDISKCARQYLEEIITLTENVPNDGPVVFNAMGWIRELGLRLLIDAINSSKIDLVYYLKSNTSNDLPDELDPQRLMEPHPMNGRPFYRGNNKATPEIIADQSRAEGARLSKKEIFRRDFSPRTLRDIAYSVYGNKWLDLRPLSIGFDDICFNFIDSTPRNPFQILNNCLVSLSYVNADINQIRPDRDGIKILDNTTTRAAGWGWIRHVDMRQRIIYIHTSLPIEELQSLPVNLLQVGRLPLPKCFNLNADERQVPYVQKHDKNVLSNSYKDTKPKKRRID